MIKILILIFFSEWSLLAACLIPLVGLCTCHLAMA